MTCDKIAIGIESLRKQHTPLKRHIPADNTRLIIKILHRTDRPAIERKPHLRRIRVTHHTQHIPILEIPAVPRIIRILNFLIIF